MQIQLPKLRKINVNRSKKKIFILTDDIFSPSGVGTMAKELIYGTCDTFDWVQLAAALNHPEHGRMLDLSEAIEKETGKEDVYVKQYKHNGYFSYDAFFQVLNLEKPDAVMLFTDPRHYMEFWPHEQTIRSEYKIPIIYWSIWDSELVPYWNQPYYSSCDLLLAINKQTDLIHRTLSQPSTLCKYLPHGINSKKFYPIGLDDTKFVDFYNKFKTQHNVDFIVFWNNRNIRRKQPGDVILAYKMFCDTLPKDQAEKCVLVMKTHVQDPNGTDLMAVKNHICPNYKILFIEEVLTTEILNYFYNMADVTVSLSSAEGFGLSTAESIMAGTPIIAPVHGGLQDQMQFFDDTEDEPIGSWIPTNNLPSNSRGQLKGHGNWVYPLFPVARQLQGSLQTPYIFDYICDANQLATELMNVYTTRDKSNGGREFMLNNFDADTMCFNFGQYVQELFENWKPKPSFTLELVTKEPKKEYIGLCQ